MMKIVQPKRVAPAKIISAQMMGNWLESELNRFYADSRPLWMEPRPVSKGWTPSSLGESNDRLLVASLLGYRGDAISPRLRMIFDAGNDIEARWVIRFKDIGVFLATGLWLPKTPIQGLHISGKIDILIQHPYEKDREFLVEVKSISPDGFRQLPALSNSPQENFWNLMDVRGEVGARIQRYMQQLQIYLVGLGKEEGMLLFDNKGNQDYRAYSLVRDDDFVDKIVKRCQALQRDYWEKRLIPPWPGGKSNSKSLLAVYKPDEVVSLDEFKEVSNYYVNGSVDLENGFSTSNTTVS